MKLYLKTLSIEGQKIDFSKFKTNYELKVLYDVDTLKLTAEPATEGTTVELPEDLSLQVGENNFEIKLTDGTVTSTYTIRVIRLKEGEEIKEVSKDATLKVLTLSGYNINFSPTKTVYELKVKYNVKQIAVTATPMMRMLNMLLRVILILKMAVLLRLMFKQKMVHLFHIK